MYSHFDNYFELYLFLFYFAVGVVTAASWWKTRACSEARVPSSEAPKSLTRALAFRVPLVIVLLSPLFLAYVTGLRDKKDIAGIANVIAYSMFLYQLVRSMGSKGNGSGDQESVTLSDKGGLFTLASLQSVVCFGLLGWILFNRQSYGSIAEICELLFEFQCFIATLYTMHAFRWRAKAMFAIVVFSIGRFMLFQLDGGGMNPFFSGLVAAGLLQLTLVAYFWGLYKFFEFNPDGSHIEPNDSKLPEYNYMISSPSSTNG